ncbi:MAG: hypothetical protein CMO06_04040 [Thalassospira sp.]|uniref:hypothetical protein n=1 Tax=Thalassospira sp. TaxID=1912094 RepID=UPI000C6159F2|nr:hypothetical protein [Thalassospira sp.]MAZ32304.1 hypothetical protein [Thalassospira sp.]
MAKVNRNSLRLDADFTEDTVGFAIEAFLAVLSFPRHRFTVEPFSRSKERWLGADARLLGHRIRGFRPFYMQFKRPSAYPDLSGAKVITDRKKLGLSVAPRSLFFPLRNKTVNQKCYQHNVLFKLQRRLSKHNLGNAAYVCPLFLDRSAYRLHLHLEALARWPRFWRTRPWDLEDVLMDAGGRTIKFDRIPVLAEHISIPPHDEVKNAKHNYSFDEAGKYLCFHSPKALPDGSSSLAEFLKKIAYDFLGENGKIAPDNAYQALRKLTDLGEEEESILPEIPPFSPDDPIGSWLSWGELLRQQYDIEQYAFVSWDDL